MVSVLMPCYVSLLAILVTVVHVSCTTRELKWREDTLRADHIFPDPILIRNNSSVILCIALCSQTDDCDGVSFVASTMVCRAHSLADVMDISKGVTSLGTRFWINGNCRRHDYMYVRSLDWCIKLVWTLWPKSRDDVMDDCQAEQARLVNVDSREKHNVLVRKLKHLLLFPLTTWWISGSKVKGVWQWDDGTPISLDNDMWNTLPPIPFFSNCLCYFEQLIPIGKRFWPCVCLGSNGVICEEFP